MISEMSNDDSFEAGRSLRNIFNLSDKVALVTGAASGLGQMISCGLAEFGANIIAADINITGVEETSKNSFWLQTAAFLACFRLKSNFLRSPLFFKT